MKKLKGYGVGQDLFIVLNGPSIKNQDLTVLKGKNLLFVNRGFLHKDYKLLQPKYHVFIDSKMKNGIWPTSWLDDIWALSPDTTIILPIEWYNNPRFSSYKNSTHIIWADYNLPFTSLGVAGACFSFAIKQQFNTVYFTGFDANGPAYEMLERSESHFYGSDGELSGRNSLQFALSLYMHARHLRDWYLMGDYVKKFKTKFFNFTDGGMIDSFQRIDISSFQ